VPHERPAHAFLPVKNSSSASALQAGDPVPKRTEYVPTLWIQAIVSGKRDSLNSSPPFEASALLLLTAPLLLLLSLLLS
jgi:hypothetical protein